MSPPGGRQVMLEYRDCGIPVTAVTDLSVLLVVGVVKLTCGGCCLCVYQSIA